MTDDRTLTEVFVPRDDEASTVTAIRRAALHLVATCSEESLAAVVEALEREGHDVYGAVTKRVLEDRTPVTTPR